MRAAGSGGKRDKTDRGEGKGNYPRCGGTIAWSTQFLWRKVFQCRAVGRWVGGVGGGVATRGVRLLIGKEVLLLLTSFHDFVEILWGTRITSAHCQLRRKSMIAVSLTQKEVRPVQQQEFPGLFARKASLASFAGWVRARGIW